MTNHVEDRGRIQKKVSTKEFISLLVTLYGVSRGATIAFFLGLLYLIKYKHIITC
jgi:hypothetical protein